MSLIPPNIPPPNSTGGPLSAVIVVAQNIVTAINSALQNYLNVQGIANFGPISGATLVKQGTGRVATVSVVAAGSAVGSIYDTNSVSSTAGLLYIIPNTVGPVFVNMPVSKGIVVAPGTDQVVTISYS